MAWLRRTLLSILWPLTHMIGQKSVRKRPTLSHYSLLLSLMQPGDVLVSFTKWRPTNWLIPGHFNHSGLYVGDGHVIQAVAPDVANTELAEFLGSVDDVAVLRPLGFKQPQLEQACADALGYVGIPYDYMFEPGNHAFYCSELVYTCLAGANPDWHFTLRECLGVQTALPQDFMDATKLFTPIWNSQQA